jgi:O-antigen/teichoic acid export membrane protein
MTFNIFKTLLFKNTFLYTMAQLINGIIPFLLLPVLTKYLSPSDYGVISIYNSYIGLLSIFVGIGISGAIEISYFKMRIDEFKKYLSNAIFLLLLFFIIVFGVVYVFENTIIEFVNIPTIWYYIAVTVSFFQIITFINLALWRVNHEAKYFALYSVLLTMANIVISLIFIILYKLEWEGRLIGISSAIILFGMLSVVLIILRGYLTFNISSIYIKDIFKFSVSLIPHRLALWIKSSINIFLITSIVGIEHTGLYTISLQLGMVVNIFSSAFNSAYGPYLFEKLKSPTYKIKLHLVKFIYTYSIFIFLFSIIIGNTFIYIIPYVLDVKFHDSVMYVLGISISYSIHAVYLIIVNYLFFIKKNNHISFVTVISSIFHFLISYFLINIYGISGAIYASILSSVLMLILIWMIMNKFYDMPWLLKNEC